MEDIKEYLLYYENDSDYHDDINRGGVELPNVSYTEDENIVYYNPLIIPQIRYTTTDNEKISDDIHGLTNVISHEWNDNLQQFVIKLDQNTTTLPRAVFNSSNTLTSVEFIDCDNITTIKESFIKDCPNLTSINVNGLTNVNTISQTFITKCDSLEKINLSKMTKISSEIKTFLTNNKNLKEIVLPKKMEVKALTSFCVDVPNLEYINLSSLNLTIDNVGTIFKNCGLKQLDLSSFRNIKLIGEYSFRDMPNLTSIDLSPLSNVTEIWNHSFCNLSNITEIDLSPLSKITYIPSGLLAGSKMLQSVDLTVLTNIEHINNDLLKNSTINDVKLPLGNIISVSDGFLENCPYLRNIDLSSLSNVTSISGNFLAYDYAIESIDLSPLSNVDNISYNFLLSLTKVNSIDLEPLKNVKNIDAHFLQRLGIEEIDLSPLSNVTKVGSYFLQDLKVTKIDLSVMTSLEKIGDNCFESSKVTWLKTHMIGTFLAENIRNKIKELIIVGDTFQDELGDTFNGEFVNDELKIYVSPSLIEKYKETFTELSDRFFTIED